MLRTIRIVAAAALVAACVAPGSSTIAGDTRRAAERDVAAAVATWTVRAGQPVVVSTNAGALTTLPTLTDGSTPVRVLEDQDGAQITLIGPYRHPRTGRAEVTRVATRLENGRLVSRFHTEPIGGGDVTEGSYTALAPVRVLTN